MSGKPAARLSDPTACPIPGHGTNPIAAGSPDVLFDSLPAARQGDPSACGGALSSAVIPTVLINGKPATTIGTVGSHGNVVVGGSGTVLIGSSGGGAAVSPVAALSMAAIAAPKTASGGGGGGTSSAATTSATPTSAATAAAAIQTSNAKQEAIELDYRLKLKSGGNHLLTPLEIPDYDELANATTQNKESIDFLVDNRKQTADSLSLEVFDGSTLLYAEPDTSALLSAGKHPWQWDGYSMAGVLDTQVLKSPNLCIRLTAHKGGQQHVVELKLENKAAEVKWVDARIDRNAKTVEVTVRPSFSDGGVKGNIPGLAPTPYKDRETFAKEGIELHWSRNGMRAPGIGSGINSSQGTYQLTVTVDLVSQPKAKTFPLTENLTVDGGRSTSLGGFRNIHHNVGRAYDAFVTKAKAPSALQAAKDYAREDFLHTAAHEFGHFILNSYGDGGLIPHYSWTHKGSSTLLQNEIDGTATPRSGEIDVMHYFKHYAVNDWDRWSRTVAAEVDAKGLIWLARVQFDD